MYIPIPLLRPQPDASLSLAAIPAMLLARLLTLLPFFTLPLPITSLSLAGPRQASVDSFVASESSIALAGVLANIGPDGAKCEGAASGVVLASPSTTSPDYDYEWIRDASLVNKLLIDRYTQGRDGSLQGTIESWISSMAIIQQVPNPSGNVSTGGLGEPKFNPDMTAFTGAWGRPQRDGPALRAIAMMTYASYKLGQGNTSYVQDVLWPSISLDLGYVAQNWNQTGFDLWEELDGSSFFTILSQFRALHQAAPFASQYEDSGTASAWAEQAGNILCFLQSFWDSSASYALANINLASTRSGLDANTVLASIHAFDPEAGCDAATFQPCSDKALANHKAVVDSFRGLYGLNSQYGPDQAVAIGRYQEDVYYNGNPWYLATLAAAEQLYASLYTWASQSSLTVTATSEPFFAQFLSSVAPGTYSASTSEYATITAGAKSMADGFVAIVQQYIGPAGGLSEQFDKSSGAPTSAVDLTWSYASFLTMADARAGLVPASWGASSATVPTGTCQPGPQPPMVQLTFVEDAKTTYGQNVFLTGSISQLSDWSTTDAVALSSASYPDWQVTVSVPAGATFQYKFIKVENGEVTWESDPNREYTAPSSGSATVNDTWR
ncbi:carbohydrate-binding module family 20 protein [Calocera cornea HHB12733]|uniref:Glucoamylase n=1 Tax=Calocera cornea HHB12733 TaxID=1353952 RepID=A0A165K963_9BASI|nr:carbohydrate-binding module family 20 protein [Calocera cornea HHB12733]